MLAQKLKNNGTGTCRIPVPVLNMCLKHDREKKLVSVVEPEFLAGAG